MLKKKNNKNFKVNIKEVGLRKGEKLSEELLIDAQAQKTSHPLIYKAIEKSLDYKYLNEKLDKLDYHLDKNNTEEAINILREIVPEWLRN